MAMTFVQRNDDPSCIPGNDLCCTTVTSDGRSGTQATAAVGASAGTDTWTLAAGSSATAAFAGFMQIVVDSGVTWGAGDWTVRFNVTGSNMNLTLNEVWLCRVNSSCTNQELIGSTTGLGISLSTTGVKTVTVTGGAVTPGAGDFVGVVVVVANGAMSGQSATVTLDQNIDSPFTSGEVAITASSGAIRYQGQTPTVVRTANQSINAVSGAIRYTGQTPTAFADNPVSIAAASGAIRYTGQTPTVNRENNTYVDAVSGAIVYAGQTPTVARTENQSINAVSGAIVYAGQTPSVSTAASVDINAVSGAIVYTGQTPTVARTENQDIAGVSGAIRYTGQTPSVATDDSIAIPAVSGSIIYAGQVPLVEVSVDQLPVEAPTVVAGRPARRMRRRLLCRINGEIVEIEDVNHLFKLLKECRKDIKELAYEKAQEIVRTGRRVSEVREQEPRAVEVIDAPRAAMEAIEDRIREMEAFYWLRVSAGVKQIQRDDEEALFLMGQL